MLCIYLLTVRYMISYKSGVYSNRHDNLTDDIRLGEEKASTKRDHHQKADTKLAQANSKITELEAKLMGLQRELVVLQKQDKSVIIRTKA